MVSYRKTYTSWMYKSKTYEALNETWWHILGCSRSFLACATLSPLSLSVDLWHADTQKEHRAQFLLSSLRTWRVFHTDQQTRRHQAYAGWISYNLRICPNRRKVQVPCRLMGKLPPPFLFFSLFISFLNN